METPIILPETRENENATKKTPEQINHELIRNIAMCKAIRLEVKNLLKYGKSIDDNTFNNCIIDAYVEMRDAGQLKT